MEHAQYIRSDWWYWPAMSLWGSDHSWLYSTSLPILPIMMCSHLSAVSVDHPTPYQWYLFKEHMYSNFFLQLVKEVNHQNIVQWWCIWDMTMSPCPFEADIFVDTVHECLGIQASGWCLVSNPTSLALGGCSLHRFWLGGSQEKYSKQPPSQKGALV